MRELDYKPNRAARLLRGGKAQALGFIVGAQGEMSDSPDIDRRMPSYAADVNLGLLQACRTAENHMLIESVSAGDAGEAQAIFERVLDMVKLDGIGVVPPLCDKDWQIDVLYSRDHPFEMTHPGLP